MKSFAVRFTLSLVSLLTSNALAADDSDSDIPSIIPTTPSAVFVYNGSDYSDGSDEFVFALNVDEEAKDVYIHMSAPSGNEWMAVGIGGQMKDALMFVAYPSKNGTGMTLSPRLGQGHTEPAWYSHVTCTEVWDGLENANTVTSGSNGTMTVDAVCHNATTWNGGSLSMTSATQDFIFAVGPGTSGPGGNHGGSALQSNSLSAGLKRHTFNGHFTMDMTQAVSANSSTTSGVPKPNGDNDSDYVTENASVAINAGADNDPAPAIHAFVMCLTFVIIYPLGALILRLLHRVILHAVVQTIGLVLFCMATAGGIVISQEYIRSKHFNSAHQVIGILLLLALFGQLGLGIIHHRIYKKEQKPTIMGKIHKYLGPAVIFIGIINAFIGFVFAGNPHLCLPLLIIIIVVALVFTGVRWCCGRRQQKQKPRGVPAGTEGYQYPDFGAGPGQGGQAPPYEHLGPPPAYGRSESYRSDDVPLQPYESQSSGLQQAHPRPMV